MSLNDRRSWRLARLVGALDPQVVIVLVVRPQLFTVSERLHD